jgi:aspartyl-tRNA(Asn)/glutamyl-tRNA(Gln) amidotransferase subunit B
VHDRYPGKTAIDLNRAGTPLAEIVSEPDLRSPAEARAYLVALRQLLVYTGVSECSMEQGSLRVDANLSIRRPGDARLGTKAEVKNLNSFANVERALEAERDRQIALAERGERIAQVTLLFDAGTGQVRPLRSKEESHDYRYFPDPDLPPLVLPPQWIAEQRAALPELPDARRARLELAYGLPAYDARVLTGELALGEYFESVVGAGLEPKTAANWVMGEVMTSYNETGGFPVSPDRLAALATLVRDGTVSLQAAKRIYGELARGDRDDPGVVAKRLGLVQVSDQGALAGWVDEVLAAHPAEVARYRGGEAKLIGFFVGQVMKRSQGKADPKGVQPVLQAKLG